MLLGVIGMLFRGLVKLVWLIIQVLVIIVLAILDFLLIVLYMALQLLKRLLPWFLKAVAVALWVFGLWFSFDRVTQFYSAFTVNVVQAAFVGVAVVLLELFGPLIVLLESRERIFQTFAAVGALGLVFAALLSQVRGDPSLYLIAGVLPYFGVGVLTVYLAIKFRSERGQNV